MDDVFFYLSKNLWTLLSPDSLFLLLLVLCLVFFLTGRTRRGVLLLGALVLSLLFLAVFPLGDWMLAPLEKRFAHNPPLPDQVDGIIVLGGSVIPDRSADWQQLETNRFHERLTAFTELAKRYPEARLVFTGGNASTDADDPTEAEVLQRYFFPRALPGQRLLIEDRARNTYENAIYSRKLARPAPAENWILVTSAFHMPRAVGVFCARGWQVLPWPVDHQILPSRLYEPGFSLMSHAEHLVMATHEWLGLLAYYLSGKTERLLPAQCHRPVMSDTES